ncbi:Uncharacterised protein [Candidatus Tiddalikarchaeum anstoanum]|nr:Uncharacterised protein [Candidatus Tiddalikarchaeum anstoanum]
MFTSGCTVNVDTSSNNIGTVSSNLESEPGLNACCAPFCTTTDNITCEQMGGTFTAASCSEVDDCKISCCDPFCAPLTKVECEQRGGIATGLDCSAVDECQNGCCTPYCAELTQAECGEEHGYGGTWHEGSCTNIDECSNICCSPFNTLTTRTRCEQLGGSEASEESCIGSGRITVELRHEVSCNCADEGSTDTCQNTLTIIQSFSVNLIPDTNTDNNVWDWLVSEQSYNFKGTGTYILTGSENRDEYSSYTMTCLNPEAPIGSRGLVATTTRTTREYTGSDSAEVTATIMKNSNGKYDISWSYPYMIGTMNEHFSRTVTSECQGINPSFDSEDSEEEIEGVIIENSVTNVDLTGSSTFMQYPPENMFACENVDNRGTGIITWSFSLPQ